MGCTTLLVGKNASYDGSTLMARNDDSGAKSFQPKRFLVVNPEDQPRHYRSVLSHVEIDLPDNPMRYTTAPNADHRIGIWAQVGINEDNVAMSATETLTANERVLGADPLVVYQPAKDGQEEKAGGIGEEDLITITLPYVHTAREAVKRLGSLHEQFGTYEMNGVGLQDVNEIWWFETIGGHHWMAARVPDDSYVIVPNQLGIDHFDFDDAYGEQKNFMCSPGLLDFTREYHLDLRLSADEPFNPRLAYGTHSDSDHVYNTCRAWDMARYLNPRTYSWYGPDAQFRPDDDDIPWSLVPEHKITIEDMKLVLSLHFQGTEFDEYGHYGDPSVRGKYRPVGINRNEMLGITQIRPYAPKERRSVEWVTVGSNVFNAIIPLYSNVSSFPEYLTNTTDRVSTDNFYWSIRLIAALADASYQMCKSHIERYQLDVQSKGCEKVARTDRAFDESNDPSILARANEEMVDYLKKATDDLLWKVLDERSKEMKNRFARDDA